MGVILALHFATLSSGHSLFCFARSASFLHFPNLIPSLILPLSQYFCSLSSHFTYLSLSLNHLKSFATHLDLVNRTSILYFLHPAWIVILLDPVVLDLLWIANPGLW